MVIMSIWQVLTHNIIYVSIIELKRRQYEEEFTGFNAFDAACPNQAISSCSTMTINGINAVCGCDNSEYSLFTGQGPLQYPLKQYRVQVNGNVLRVYN